MKRIVANIPHGLMAKLGKALKIDFFELQKAGRVSPDTIARMQNHCDACPEPGACAQRMDQSRKTLEEPPAFCPNHRLLVTLKGFEKKA